MKAPRSVLTGIYPGCYFRYVDDEAVTDRPIRIARPSP
jgi:hypothetical protein